MFGIGGTELLLIMVVALLVFGPKRLPELARTMGRGLAEFRRASSDLRRSIDLEMDPRTTSAPDPAAEPPAQAGAPAVTPGLKPSEPDEDPAPGTDDASAKSDQAAVPPGATEPSGATKPSGGAGK